MEAGPGESHSSGDTATSASPASSASSHSPVMSGELKRKINVCFSRPARVLKTKLNDRYTLSFAFCSKKLCHREIVKNVRVNCQVLLAIEFDILN